MTPQEFSMEFDLLYNNLNSNQAPGLNEYEKSVFATKAQEEIVKNHYTAIQGGNKYQQGIEDSSKRYSDFSGLITVATLSSVAGVNFDERGKVFDLKSLSKPIMMTITENFDTGRSKDDCTRYQVKAIKFEEYDELMSKPSADPLRKQVWKIMGNSLNGNGSVEIVPHWKDKDNIYNVLNLRYVRKPYPVILEDLAPQGLTIDGCDKPYSGGPTSPVLQVVTVKAATEGQKNGLYILADTANGVIYPEKYTSEEEADAAKNDRTLSTQCSELAVELHHEILQRAVELAKAFYVGDATSVITVGERSE